MRVDQSHNRASILVDPTTSIPGKVWAHDDPGKGVTLKTERKGLNPGGTRYILGWGGAALSNPDPVQDINRPIFDTPLKTFNPKPYLV